MRNHLRNVGSEWFLQCSAGVSVSVKRLWVDKRYKKKTKVLLLKTKYETQNMQHACFKI